MGRLVAGFITVHRDAIKEWRRTHLSEAAQGLLVNLMAEVEYSTGVLEGNLVWLASKLEVHRTTLRRRMAELRDAGWIEFGPDPEGQFELVVRILRYAFIRGERPTGVSKRDTDVAKRDTSVQGVSRNETPNHSSTSGNAPKNVKKLEDIHASSPTPHADLFTALVEVCNLNPNELTSSARGALNKAVKELGNVRATPDEVRARADRYRTLHPTWTLTPNALTRHWAELGGPTRGIYSTLQ